MEKCEGVVVVTAQLCPVAVHRLDINVLHLRTYLRRLLQYGPPSPREGVSHNCGRSHPYLTYGDEGRVLVGRARAEAAETRDIVSGSGPIHC